MNFRFLCYEGLCVLSPLHYTKVSSWGTVYNTFDSWFSKFGHSGKSSDGGTQPTYGWEHRTPYSVVWWRFRPFILQNSSLSSELLAKSSEIGFDDKRWFILKTRKKCTRKTTLQSKKAQSRIVRFTCSSSGNMSRVEWGVMFCLKFYVSSTDSGNASGRTTTSSEMLISTMCFCEVFACAVQIRYTKVFVPFVD